MILGVFNLKSDIGAKRAADIHAVTNNRHRLFLLSNRQLATFSMIARDKNSLVTQYCIYQFRDMRTSSEELLESTITT